MKRKFDKTLHKPINIKFEKQEVHSPFTDDISGDDLADIQLISKFNKGIRFFYYVLLIISMNICHLFN